MAATNVVWPEALRQLFHYLSFFSISIDVASPECLIPTLEFKTKFWLTEALPLAIAGTLLLFHLCYAGYKAFKQGQGARLYSHVPRMVSVYLVICYVLYLGVTRKTLEVFNCNPLPVDDGYLYTSFTSLSCDGGSLCRYALVLPKIDIKND